MKKTNMESILFMIIAILFFILAATNKDYLDILIGGCFASLGLIKKSNDK